jgi:hypothetical protein
LQRAATLIVKKRKKEILIKRKDHSPTKLNKNM